MSYLLLTIKHKWFVLLAGLKVGVPVWQLLIHDWTKFLPWNLCEYQEQFFGDKSRSEGFINAWLRHQNSHPHHWEYWIPRTGHNRCEPPYKDNEPLAMPEKFVCEMVADWMGASRAYEGKWPDINNWDWMKQNYSKMNLHPVTDVRIGDVIMKLRGYKWEDSVIQEET